MFPPQLSLLIPNNLTKNDKKAAGSKLTSMFTAKFYPRKMKFYPANTCDNSTSVLSFSAAEK